MWVQFVTIAIAAMTERIATAMIPTRVSFLAEYSWLEGNVLVRVSHILTPDQDDEEYHRALQATVGQRARENRSSHRLRLSYCDLRNSSRGREGPGPSTVRQPAFGHGGNARR